MRPFKVLREGLGAGLAPEAVLVPPGLLRHDPLDDVRLLAADRAVLVHLHRRRYRFLKISKLFFISKYGPFPASFLYYHRFYKQL